MSVASSETELFKDKIEVSLDGRQIFYLFFGGAVIATLVFVLGVMVGRQVESRSVAETGSPATDPLAALDRLEGGDELAFPAALRGDEVILGSVDATHSGRKKLAQEPLATGGPGALAPTLEQAAAEKIAADKEAAAQAEAEKAAAAAEKAKDGEAKAESKKAKAEKAREEKAAKKAAAEAKEAEASAPKAKRRRFTLQVGSFQDKEEADTFFRGLSGGPYDPYMVEADVPGKGKYYRVRVGGYGSFDEAVEAKTEFEASQHVIAYVTRLK